MRIGIFSFRAFDRRLARLAAPISSGVRQGAEYAPPPAGRVRLNTPAGRGLSDSCAIYTMNTLQLQREQQITSLPTVVCCYPFPETILTTQLSQC